MDLCFQSNKRKRANVVPPVEDAILFGKRQKVQEKSMPLSRYEILLLLTRLCLKEATHPIGSRKLEVHISGAWNCCRGLMEFSFKLC